ncbi:alkaline phosphatase PhoX [Variovorax paradoxus]|uniref:PhoX family protein n=1 Tax=Variovorax paradoxus TaxID=34073 RepID=UPI001ABC1BB5
MAKNFDRMEDSNLSANPTIHEVSDPARRVLVRGGLAAAVAGLFGPLAAGSLAGCASTAGSGGGAVAGLGRAIGFKGIAMAAVDQVVVPEGYSAQVLYRWGDPTGVAGSMPAFKTDGSNSADDQALQAGMHHDGMAFFPIEGSNRGLLVLNHEYVDDGLLHVDGMKTWTPEKVRKSMNAHGVSVIELQRDGAKWSQVLPSRFARRVTALTPMTLSGPAAGHPMLRTAADPSGTQVLGTYNNCSNGQTPWGTYLTCEENFADYFEGPESPDAHQKRWGIRKGNGAKYRWHEHEPRFDAAKNPNEPNRYGWVVEIDPQDPASVTGEEVAA